MTEEEFYAKVKEKYGSRGVRQAKEVISAAPQEEPFDKNGLLAQAMMAAFFMSKDKAREKFTPKKYRK